MVDEEPDDSGYYISLQLSKEYLGRGADWEKVTKEGYQLIAWYDGDEYITGDSTKALYNGAMLDAVWQNGETAPEIDAEITDILGENPIIVTENLGEGEKLVLNPLSPDEDKQCRDALAQVLQGKGLIGDANEAVGINISVKKGDTIIDKEGDKVKITLPVPEALEIEDMDGYEIKAVHFKEDTDGADVFPVTLNESRTFMTFTAEHGFSPFYFIKTKQTEKVTVTIDNVPGGFITAYTGSKEDRTYLPIGEPVELDADSPIYLGTNPYPKDGYWTKCVSATAYYDDGSSVPVDTIQNSEGRINTLKPGTCHIKAEFAVDTKTNSSAPFSLSWSKKLGADPRKNGVFKAEISVSKYDAEKKTYVHLDDCRLELATREELTEAGLRESDVDDLMKDADQFTFDPNTNVLCSKEELIFSEDDDSNRYEIPFVIICKDPEKGEQRYVSYRMNPDGPVYAYDFAFNLGVYTSYNLPFVAENGEYWYNGSEQLGSERFIYEEGVTNWDSANPEKALRNWFGEDRIPKMHNYTFAGWMDEDGQLYQSGSELNGGYSSFSVYARFVDAEDKTKIYEPKEADYSVFDGLTPGENNPGGNNPGGTTPGGDKPGENNPGGTTPGGTNSGSSGGSGGSGSSSGSHSAGTNSYTMTGSWAGDVATGWKFLKSNGEYAANTWGWINGQYYYFNAAGNMVTGWCFINGYWYYLNPAEGSLQGAMLTGVIFDPVYNAYFCADASGAMVTGWYQVGANWYYFNPVSDGRQGALLADTYIDGYYVGADGAWVPAN